VFLEAAAAGTPQLARRSGGSAEAVLDGVTGRVLDTDVEPAGVADAITSMLGDSEALAAMADASRKRASQEFGYDHLAASLDAALQEW
jgi:glycosyltransferase involved in cell wall biosynthesis